MIVAITMLLILGGCDAPPEAKAIVRDKHAQMYVWVNRINDSDLTRHPKPEQNEEMLRAVLKDMESLDKLLNNWKKNSSMDETNLRGEDTADILKKYRDIEITADNND